MEGDCMSNQYTRSIRLETARWAPHHEGFLATEEIDSGEPPASGEMQKELKFFLQQQPNVHGVLQKDELIICYVDNDFTSNKIKHLISQLLR